MPRGSDMFSSAEEETQHTTSYDHNAACVEVGASSASIAGGGNNTTLHLNESSIAVEEVAHPLERIHRSPLLC